MLKPLQKYLVAHRRGYEVKSDNKKLDLFSVPLFFFSFTFVSEICQNWFNFVHCHKIVAFRVAQTHTTMAAEWQIFLVCNHLSVFIVLLHFYVCVQFVNTRKRVKLWKKRKWKQEKWFSCDQNIYCWTWVKSGKMNSVHRNEIN